ncbi:sensor domain-containing diguanylate cyclase [Alkalihalophilus pseudofirmus]|uniref:sensor domain-containing diguanylate cyclase n=1 Tax=Alkalihalophilus pseudofirmus TaxID=79885 RepID=UPI00259B807A|nr:sensor domain-containing diguanylate cyclase [Alkalihalophilus pseudofirmus]WEG17145.1 sensor domain-containing diguanylate cyclase [Alkalihalophilus pseudofirmus]
MKMIGKKTALIFTVITILITLTLLSYTWLATVVLLSIPVVWWLGGIIDDASIKMEQLKIKAETLEAANEKLQEKKEEYESLLDLLEGAIFQFSLSSNEMYVSEGMKNLYGTDYTHERLKDWKASILPDYQLKVEEHEQRLLAGESSKVEFEIVHPEQGRKWIMQIATPIADDEGEVTKIIGQMIDITSRKTLENELKQMAFYDELTDLPNRKSLYRHIEKALARSKRHQHTFSLMFIDLDDFKIVNDTMGHDAGDMLLKEVVSRLNESIREEDLISRIGGDEFIVLFEETCKEEIESIAERILERVAMPYEINEKEANISLSIGVSMYPDDGEDKDTLIEHADQAMYFAKFNGKNSYKLYTPDLSDMEYKKVSLLDKFKHTFQKAKLFS